MTGQDGLRAWGDEHEAFNCGLDEEVEDLADSVKLPGELHVHQAAAENDPDFASLWDEWWWHLQSRDLSIAVEQCCSEQGLLLSSDMRALRLRRIPSSLQFALSVFLQGCPRHLGALLVHRVFWLVRFERITRTGQPRLVLIDEDDCRGP